MATVDLLGSSEFGQDEEKVITFSNNETEGYEGRFESNEDPNAHMTLFDAIKDKIAQIEVNRQEIVKLNGRYHSSTTVENDKTITKDLDLIMGVNLNLTREIKKDLDNLKSQNDKFAKENKGSSVLAWRQNQLNSITRKFKESSVSFQTTLSEFNKNLKNKQTRQIRILDTDNKLKEEDVEELANDPQRADEFIQQQFQMVDVGDEFLDRLADIEARHEGMKKIEQSIKELHVLFTELSVLIDEQQERLDSITQNVEQTKDYIKSGTKSLIKAEAHQKCSRKLQFGMACCGLALLLIVIIALAGSGSFS